MSKKKIHTSQQRLAGDKGKEEGVKPLPKGIYYKVISEGKKTTAKASYAPQYRHRTLHGVDYKRKEVRQQSWWNTNSVPFERTDRGLDYRNATDVYRGTNGRFTSLPKWDIAVLAIRHTRWLNTHLRDRNFSELHRSRATAYPLKNASSY